MTNANGATMLVNGACHCGSVRLSASIHPSKVYVCHCVECQVLTGRAFRVVVPVVAGSLSVQGDVNEYARTAESGAVRLQLFRPTCGTSMYAHSAEAAGLASLRVGILAERAQLKPVAQFWRRSALPWVSAMEGVPGCQHQELLGQP